MDSYFNLNYTNDLNTLRLNDFICIYNDNLDSQTINIENEISEHRKSVIFNNNNINKNLNIINLYMIKYNHYINRDINNMWPGSNININSIPTFLHIIKSNSGTIVHTISNDNESYSMKMLIHKMVSQYKMGKTLSSRSEFKVHNKNSINNNNFKPKNVSNIKPNTNNNQLRPLQFRNIQSNNTIRNRVNSSNTNLNNNTSKFNLRNDDQNDINKKIKFNLPNLTRSCCNYVN